MTLISPNSRINVFLDMDFRIKNSWSLLLLPIFESFDMQLVFVSDYLKMDSTYSFSPWRALQGRF